MYLMVVKRGDFQQFDHLHKTFAATRPVQVVWDRRRRDRRDGQPAAVETERRLSERRGPAPASWTGLNFVVVQADPA